MNSSLRRTRFDMSIAVRNHHRFSACTCRNQDKVLFLCLNKANTHTHAHTHAHTGSQSGRSQDHVNNFLIVFSIISPHSPFTLASLIMRGSYLYNNVYNFSVCGRPTTLQSRVWSMLLVSRLTFLRHVVCLTPCHR